MTAKNKTSEIQTVYSRKTRVYIDMRGSMNLAVIDSIDAQAYGYDLPLELESYIYMSSNEGNLKGHY